MMDGVKAPAPIAALLALPGIAFAARLLLAAPFLVSGILKAADPAGAAAEVAGLGLQPALPVAMAVIATQIGGSLLFLSRRWCWLGAGLLAGFTLVATLLAHAFWTFDGPDRARQTAVFLEHMAIIGGLAIAAIHRHGSHHGSSRSPAPSQAEPP
ncbi:MAG: hypothetical protein RLY86_1628 [Pseudomonadota bacterium]|jgi:uncharacterized membrane protein YphA (DoxX/SURF4 family)